MERRFKYKNGLVLGKFYPFHLGHAYLIDQALNHSKTVHVMVCVLAKEKISPLDRFLMVAKHYHGNKRVEVHLCTDENPQHPEECESLDKFYNEYWVPSVYKFINSLDVVFTSEDYGDEFANYLGVDHVLIDKERVRVPISGTLTRNDVMKNFHFLPTSTQQYFEKTICIVGSESTGKSTMVEKLAEYFQCNSVPEYGRAYVETIKADMLCSWDFEVIAINHDRLCKKAISDNNDKLFLFIDTDAVVTSTFMKLYLGKNVNEIVDNVKEYQNFDLYLLLTPEVNWVNDGTRDFPEESKRWEHFNMIKNQLIESNKNFIIIDGDNYQERFNQAIKKIKDLYTVI